MLGKMMLTRIFACCVMLCLVAKAARGEDFRLDGGCPQLFVAKMKGDDAIEIRAVTQVVYQTKGEKQDPRVPLQVTNQECSFVQSLSVFDAHTVKGAPVAGADLVRRLAKPTAVLLLSEREMSPFFFELFKDDTIVLRYKKGGNGVPGP